MRAARRLATALLVLGAASAGSRAQGIDCDGLRQQLAAVTRADPGRDARFVRAIEQQRSELARTQAYADSIGCGGFNLFGDAPAQCGTIENRISRMQANLDALETQAQTLRNGNPEQAQDLEARYDAYCRTTPGQDGAAVYNDPGLMPDQGAGAGEPANQDGGARGGDKAICVRTCDGGFFPLGTGARSDDLGGLQALCSAQCPNAEAKLYTTADTDNIAGAVAVDGTAYSELPNAFKYTKAHDASCTCKPPGQSWVQALARAEDLLDKQGTDVTVTEKMSADMARPAQPAPAPVKKGKRDRKGGFDLPPPPTVAADAALGALAAQAPTASTASAGIATGGKVPTPVVHADEGAVKTVPGPDGSSRRVRIIGPGL